jgi:hypothetical protein
METKGLREIVIETIHRLSALRSANKGMGECDMQIELLRGILLAEIGETSLLSRHLGDSYTILVKRPNPDAAIIPAVKAMRAYQNLGLKEAKEFIDTCAGQAQPLVSGLDMAEVDRIRGIFRDCNAESWLVFQTGR